MEGLAADVPVRATGVGGVRVRTYSDARTVTGTVGLVVLLVSGFLLAAGYASHPSPVVPQFAFPGWMQGPFGNLDFYLGLREAPILAFVMFAAYLAVLACRKSLPTRAILGAIVALNLIFLLAPPLLSQDIFSYLNYARLGALHGVNPYVHPPAAVRTDGTYTLLYWRYVTTAYGPIFTLPTYLVAPLGIAAGMWTLKLLSTVASLGCVALVWGCARRLGRDPLMPTVLFALNPVVLFFGVGGGHNDFWMTAAVLGGIYLALARREMWAGASLAAAVAIKASAALVLPFMALAMQARSKLLLGALLAALGIGAVSFAVFGVHAADFLVVLRSQQSRAMHGVPKDISRVLNLHVTVGAMRPFAFAACGSVFAWGLYRVYRGFDWMSAAGWMTLVVLGTTSWLLPWYVIWLLPIAGLSESRRLRVASVAFSALVLFLRTRMWLPWQPWLA